MRATKSNIAYFETQRKQLEAENEKRKSEADKHAKNLEGLKVAIIRQASESGQMYGSVTARDIAETVSEVTGEKIERNMVEINQNFKYIGLFPVNVRLHPEVKVEITVNIARSADEAKTQEKTGRALIAEAGGVVDSKAAIKAAEEEDKLKEALEKEAYEAEKARLAAEEEEKAEAEKKKAEKVEEEANAASEAEAESAEAEAAETEQTGESEEETTA
jgi:large subunit ribosomal protein L9